ncbi:retinol dehydrogenase 13-like [Macrosteles quadrilineatus]|uniref:retinol dehydrogenase 13-like n=1 Tax=Macrosteles quadrilineatus TaxID=74068 RepID=UPI0023E0AFCA|nr:retinol dehydrogenase 13-like [Macrosteles quadrilineatus]
MDGKTAIVTGSSSGVGYHTALELYKRGGNVILASRSLRKLQETEQRFKRYCANLKNVGQLSIIELDLSSLESVRKCVKTLLDQQPEIHILSIAGVVLYNRELSEDGYEMQFAVNHLGHFLLTLLLLPRIIRSAPSRIINVTSEPHCIGQ